MHSPMNVKFDFSLQEYNKIECKVQSKQIYYINGTLHTKVHLHENAPPPPPLTTTTTTKLPSDFSSKLGAVRPPQTL